MRTILERTNTEKGLRAVFVIAFLLLLLSYTISVFTNKQLRRQADRVEHTNSVMKLLDQMLAEVKDAETGVRGYLIFRNISMLSPYFGSRETAESTYHQLRLLITDSPQQKERLESLYANIRIRFITLQQVITVYNANNREITDSLRIIQSREEYTMDRIRLTVALMKREENRLLEERNRKMSSTFELVNLVTFISVLLTVLLIVFGIITYREATKARKKSLEELTLYDQRLRQRIEELDRANSELLRMRSQEKFAITGRIARTIAHEVRNPLTNINLAADQLNSEITNKDENTAFLFNMIDRNSNRINQLIADLLNSTKIPDLNMEKIRAGELLDETLRQAEDRIRLKRARVIKEYDDLAVIQVDRHKMKIALLNIIINALEAMEQQEDIVLELSTARVADRCRITISDRGPGMDEEALSRIFEPYFTSKAKGNGLGLTNTQNIILNHNGEITVESTLGKGTSFSIFFNAA